MGREMRRVTLTGSGLVLDDVLAVARGGAKVDIDPVALVAMARARAVAEQSIADGRPAYAVTTGVGSRKSFDIEAADHDRLLVRQHRISQGSPVPHEVGAQPPSGSPTRSPGPRPWPARSSQCIWSGR